MDFTFEAQKNIRSIFYNIIKNNTLEDLNKIPIGFNNNVIWNIAHCVVTQHLLTYKLSGLDGFLASEMIESYRKDTKPERNLSQEEVDDIQALLLSTIEKTKLDYGQDIFNNFNEYTVSTTGNTLRNINDALEFSIVHDSIHYGYVLALLKVIKN
ncbi:DinB family protein [Tamlana sp. 2_MG-2023]|uniref:DinB family protein n=1 Tax=unclassified Tamlana TaxID=2614803 RepID=UPI0026E16595|nr:MULTISPECIES: DinB family protein [unclassified Tamlana]MDO6759871.1 DinB family protein [Tamlana sp. 2_MG-2023]MDO6791959.1 DinB family protein [Tamlana sp. 1_MG-2023]